MMGRREDGQGQFFYAFDLDKVVPPDHLVRQIEGVLDLSWVHRELAPYYSHTGRPSIDPVLMIRMLIVGYVFAIRSERRICAEVRVNLAYRWFCKLGIEDKIPDHSVFCRARNERFRESDALRRVFEGVVGTCIAAGLVGGEAFSIDASLIKADVDKKKRAPGDQPIAWPKAEEASRAVQEYPGEQPAILDLDLFDAVQVKLNDQMSNHTAARAKSDALLIGRIYDDRGNRMSPSHARKGGIKYRYYLSSPLLHGQPGRVGLVRRVPAAEVEALVGCAVREHLGDPTESEDRDLIRNHVVRVEVQADQLAVELKAEKAPSDPPNAVDHDRLVLRIPWKKTPMKRRRDLIVPASVSPHDRRPIRAETRATLVASIARGRRWLDEIVAGTVTSVEQIAARDKCSIRQVNMTISLAFLAPDLVKAAVEGRLPRGVGVARLRDAPAEWSRQYAMLGLSI